jgi:hypothetical protein
MKKILLLASLLLTGLVVNAQSKEEFDILSMDYGDFAPYEDGYVTFQSAWEGAGWNFTDADDEPDGSLANFTDFVLKLAQPCDFQFQVKVKYYCPGAVDPWTAGQINNFVESETIVTAGTLSTTVSLNFTHSAVGLLAAQGEFTPAQIMAIYIQDRDEYAGYEDLEARGTVYLSEAYVQNLAKTEILYYGFEVAEVGSSYSSYDVILLNGSDPENAELDFEDGPLSDPLVPSVATIVAEGKDGKGLEMYYTDHNQVVKLPIKLPVGTTVADIESIKFDLSIPEAINEDIYKDMLILIDGVTLNKLGVYGQIGGLDGAWKTNEYRITETMAGYEDVKGLNAFDLYLGAKLFDATSQTGIIDNVTIVLLGSTEYTRPGTEEDLTVDDTGIAYIDADSNVIIYTIEGGIAIESEGAKTTVYALDGSVVASTFDTTISLKKGIYLVKVGNAKTAKVIVD